MWERITEHKTAGKHKKVSFLTDIEFAFQALEDTQVYCSN